MTEQYFKFLVWIPAWNVNTPFERFLVYLWQNSVFVISFCLSSVHNTAPRQFLLPTIIHCLAVSTNYPVFSLASSLSIFNFFDCFRLLSSFPRVVEQVQCQCRIGFNNTESTVLHIVVFSFSWPAFSELTPVRNTPVSSHSGSSPVPFNWWERRALSERNQSISMKEGRSGWGRDETWNI